MYYIPLTELLGPTRLPHSKSTPHPPISRKFPHPPTHTKKETKSTGKLQGPPIRRTQMPTPTKPTKKPITKCKLHGEVQQQSFITPCILFSCIQLHHL